MKDTHLPPSLPSTTDTENATPADKIANGILRLLGEVPSSSETTSLAPQQRVQSIVNRAAMKAATAAGMLSLPPGPLAWLTIVPEMIGVWKIQSQMVADIAAVHGKTGKLSRESMLYCLFRHTAAQAMRDLVARVGERFLVRRASLRTVQKVASRIGVKITQDAIKKSVARWVPLAGAAAVGLYAYKDTKKVAKTALEFFGCEVEEQEEETQPGPPALP